MLIPYGTDAPIYYWPFATIGLIVVNVIVYPLQFSMPAVSHASANQIHVAAQVGGMEEDDGEWEGDDELAENEIQLLFQRFGFGAKPGWYRLALSHGDGLHPLQWLTSFFIHGGILHLVGNMIFLWAFGLIVEGKVGPWVFTGLYLGIGIFQNIVEQILFLPFPTGPSLGASSAIYGIMMVSLCWAPQDNIKCMMNFWYYIWLVDIPIFLFGLVYFMWDFSLALFSGFSMGTALLHVLGAAVGVIPGIAFLAFHWVDGEQRDLISMFRELFGAQPLIKPKSKKEIDAEQRQREMAAADRVNTIERSWQSMDTHLHAGNVKAATVMFRQMQRLDSKIQWKESFLLKVISQLQKNEDWERVEIYSNEYLQQFQTKAVEVRLNLARLYLLHKSSPRKAIKTIQQFQRGELNETQRPVAQQIVRKCQQEIADGAMEIGDD